MQAKSRQFNVWIINAERYIFFYDSVHLFKNIKNNLFSCKRFVFPLFTFHGLRDIIDLQFGEISWKIFHNVFEKDKTLDAKLKKTPKVTTKLNFVKLFFWKPFLESSDNISKQNIFIFQRSYFFAQNIYNYRNNFVSLDLITDAILHPRRL